MLFHRITAFCSFIKMIKNIITISITFSGHTTITTFQVRYSLLIFDIWTLVNRIFSLGELGRDYYIGLGKCLKIMEQRQQEAKGIENATKKSVKSNQPPKKNLENQ